MKKNILLATALAITTLAGCTDDGFVGDQSLQEANGSGGAISFDMGTTVVTRAADNHTPLNDNFVVYGYKTVSSSPQVVFDNYQVKYVATSANTTESNSAGWEYVSYKNLPYGTTTTSGGTLNTDGVATNATASGIEQSIKYWDYGASQYDFFAYSLGTGSSSTWAKASAMENSTYTLEGTQAQLGTCYISDKKTIAPSSTSPTQVQLDFRSFLSKIELKFYETIPGYSVKTLKFYPSEDGTSTTTPCLYASSPILPTGGQYTISFDTNGKPQLTLTTTTPAPTYSELINTFSTTLTGYATKDYEEEALTNTYIGRASNAATSTDLVSVLPNPQNSAALNLKIDYTLVSRDKTGETIDVTGASAVIPAKFAQWLPNYKYTYIFKISDNTNGSTGQTIPGLSPITLDAVVTDTQDGTQETVTTVSTPSITTYAYGQNASTNNEYKAANIYIVVDNGTVLSDSNAKLYTVTVADGSAQGVTSTGAGQTITEEAVANVLANGTASGTTWTITDANSVTTTVTDVTSGVLSFPPSGIAAEDAPDGHAITVNCAMFNPGTYTAVSNGTKLTEGSTYYTSSAGAGRFVAKGTETATGENFYSLSAETPAGTYVFEYTDSESKKHYKIIKVVSGS